MEIWLQSLGILPLSFFQLPLQPQVKTNSTSDNILQGHQLPWKVLFSFLCWHRLLARRMNVFFIINLAPNLVQSTKQLIQLQNIFIQLALLKQLKQVYLGLLKWIAPLEPFIKLNTYGSSLGHLRLAGIDGHLTLQNCSGSWVSGFSKKRKRYIYIYIY